MPASFDLWKLILRSEASSNPLRIVFRVTTLLKESLQKNKVSSANCKILNSTSFLPILRPDSRLAFTACLTSPVNPSATTKKRKGASGSPCLNPLLGLNSSVGLPFTSTEIKVLSKQPWIQLIYFL